MANALDRRAVLLWMIPEWQQTRTFGSTHCMLTEPRSRRSREDKRLALRQQCSANRVLWQPGQPIVRNQSSSRCPALAHAVPGRQSEGHPDSPVSDPQEMPGIDPEDSEQSVEAPGYRPETGSNR